ncbi:MAG: sigma-54 dependent transcriptional regulator [Desulfuromonadales bacterium]|nr:sigma-54 dependent transcriptional regulator [Desulfuromonadales bacterium]
MADVKAKNRILVVDDEASMRELLVIMLRREGYHVDEACDGAAALEKLQSDTFDLIISDIKMPRVSGIELLRSIREQELDIVVMMITAFSTTEEAVEAMKLGAYDYITKPFKNDEIRLVVRNALERSRLSHENRSLKKALGQKFSFDTLIGKSPAMERLYSLIERIAQSQVSVLVTGESGTGKELVARAIHFNSARKDAPFVAINCGAIPENLIESELFGHEKGAFTGADQRKEGLFETANGGTLFLDEIGELPTMMQVKLLRVLQEREFRRVGGTRNLPLDIRLVSATNKDFEEEVREGRFREDLFYRLNVVRVELPPLRERREDIPLLLNHFYQKLTGETHLPISGDALQRLLDYDWPGNIRELENLVERCLVLGWQKELTADCLPAQFVGSQLGVQGVLQDIPDEGMDLENYLGDIEKKLLLSALEKSRGVRKQAAKLLGISFRSVRYRLAKYDLGEDDDA